jgi:hypothetical protein
MCSGRFRGGRSNAPILSKQLFVLSSFPNDAAIELARDKISGRPPRNLLK